MTECRMLTAKDIKAIIGCSKNRAYELMHSRSFPSIQIGHRFYVERTAFERWIGTYTGRKFTL